MTSISFNSNGSADAPGRVEDHPLFKLTFDDLNLITELVLASGSLKALAKSYGVSYPTIRNRLDAVIGRLRQAVEGRAPDPVAELLADLVERGELSGAGARAILDRVRESARGGAGSAGINTAGSEGGAS